MINITFFIIIIYMNNSYLCASCKEVNYNKPILISNDNLPEWLNKKNFVYEFINKEVKFKTKKPKEYSQILKFQLNKQYKNKYILYWAAKSCNNVLIVNDAKKAYGDFSNSGISKIDENGMVTLYFDCPQNYSTIRKDSSTKEIFYKHVHFVINDNNVWQKDKIYTHIVNCSIDYKELLNYMKNRCCLLINSLPHKYYLKEHIPNSFNLTYKDVKSMDVSQWIIDLVELSYPKLKKFIEKYSVYSLPIIIYCENELCDQSHKCMYELYKKGFVNIKLYLKGMQEYRKKN